MATKKIKAFTLAEMLVTLALTSIMIMFCYLSFNYLQQLLNQFRQQSFFITQLNELKKRGDALTTQPVLILKENDEKIVFKADSGESRLEFGEKNLLMTRAGRTDTFHLAGEKLNCGFEAFSNPLWQNRLVNQVEFDIYFQKQKFHLTFHKNYDAVTKLNLEKQN